MPWSRRGSCRSFRCSSTASVPSVFSRSRERPLSGACAHAPAFFQQPAACTRTCPTTGFRRTFECARCWPARSCWTSSATATSASARARRARFRRWRCNWNEANGARRRSRTTRTGRRDRHGGRTHRRRIAQPRSACRSRVLLRRSARSQRRADQRGTRAESRDSRCVSHTSQPFSGRSPGRDERCARARCTRSRAKSAIARLRPAARSMQQRAIELVGIFRRLRPHTFAARDRCLFHSLALVRFLSRHAVFPTWVIGVRAQAMGSARLGAAGQAPARRQSRACLRVHADTDSLTTTNNGGKPRARVAPTGRRMDERAAGNNKNGLRRGSACFGTLRSSGTSPTSSNRARRSRWTDGCARAQWTPAFIGAGLRVFCADAVGDAAGAAARKRCRRRSRCALRTQPRRSMTTRQRAEPLSVRAACEAILASHGQWLIDNCWGNYVALLRDAAGRHGACIEGSHAALCPASRPASTDVTDRCSRTSAIASSSALRRFTVDRAVSARTRARLQRPGDATRSARSRTGPARRVRRARSCSAASHPVAAASTGTRSRSCASERRSRIRERAAAADASHGPLVHAGAVGRSCEPACIDSRADSILPSSPAASAAPPRSRGSRATRTSIRMAARTSDPGRASRQSTRASSISSARSTPRRCALADLVRPRPATEPLPLLAYLMQKHGRAAPGGADAMPRRCSPATAATLDSAAIRSRTR